VVGDPQRLAALLVTTQRPALEVDAPQIVGLLGDEAGRSRRDAGAVTAPWLGQAVTLEEVADRAHRRPLLFRVLHHQARAQLAWTPSTAILGQLHDDALDLRRRAVRLRESGSRSIGESFSAESLVALDHFVRRLSTHLESAAELDHRPRLGLPSLNES
jgi:N-acetylglucosamine-6-phosphate deacetylase